MNKSMMTAALLGALALGACVPATTSGGRPGSVLAPGGTIPGGGSYVVDGVQAGPTDPWLFAGMPESLSPTEAEHMRNATRSALGRRGGGKPVEWEDRTTGRAGFVRWHGGWVDRLECKRISQYLYTDARRKETISATAKVCPRGKGWELTPLAR